MKKILPALWTFLFVLVTIFCFPAGALADEDLTIPDWVMQADLKETGDLHIVENITFEFNDEFNGVFREIVLNKTSGVTDIQIEERTEDSSMKYSQVQEADKGDAGVFLVSEDSDKLILQIFSPSEDEEKTFRISYLVHDVAIKHNDIGELYYKFLGDENQTPIGNFSVTLHLPPLDTSQEVKVFAHGPLNGQIIQINNSTYSLQVKDVPVRTYIEGRLLFPTELLPLSTNLVNQDNYNYVLEEEAIYESELIEEREKREAMGSLLEQVSLGAAILGFILFILFLILFRRPKDFSPSGDYTKIPEDCTPGVASQLTSTLISSSTIIATILDLFRKGYVRLETIKDQRNEGAQDEEYRITKVKEPNKDLLSHETHFIKWFIDEIGNGKTVTTKDIESFSKDRSTDFSTLHTQWLQKIKEDSTLKGYFDKSKTKYGLLCLLLFLPLFIVGVFALIYGSLFGIASISVALLLLIYGITLFYRRSDYGYTQCKKWLDFKKYMKETKKDTSLNHMDRYPLDISLIYALSLGVGAPLDQLDIDKKNSPQGTYYNNGWIYWYFLLSHNKNNAFEKSIDNAMDSTGTTYSGGGFTGGGGGGAGGGGAGGF